MSPATRRGHVNRALEKRNPPPRDYRSGGDAAGIYVVLDASSTRWSVWSMSMRHVPPWSRFCSAYSWRPFLRSIASSFSMINRLLFGDLMRREHDVHGRRSLRCYGAGCSIVGLDDCIDCNSWAAPVGLLFFPAAGVSRAQ